MGQVLLRADMDQVTDLIRKWCSENNFSIKHTASKIENQNTKHSYFTSITAKNRWYRLNWKYCPSDGMVLVNLQINIRIYLDILSCFFSAFGVIFWASCIKKFLNIDLSPAQINFVMVFICISIIALLLVLYAGKKLTKLDVDFFKTAQKTYDCIQLAPTDSKSSFLLSVILIFCCCGLIYIITLLFGLFGCLAVLVPIMLLALLSYCYTTHRDNPQWTWRIWIILNMFTWNRLMLMTLGVMAVLSGIEVMVPFAIDGKPEDLPLRFETKHFRKNISINCGKRFLSFI